MPIYQLPKLKKPKMLLSRIKPWKNQTFRIIVLTVFISSIFGSMFGFLAGVASREFLFSDIKDYLQKFNIDLFQPETTQSQITDEKETLPYIPKTQDERAVIEAVKEASPAVVSIIITKDLPVIEFPFYYPDQTERREIGGGSGFIVSEDGLVLTNKHVVSVEGADYTVLTNDGKKYEAEVLALDPGQDLAVLKIGGEKFPVLKLGDSNALEIGQTVIAIGNALGEFRNTVSTGVISGLGRTVTASGGGLVETLTDIIQTDAAINQGNSGGPLLNLKGEVVGVNTAMASGAENIGFAIPINRAKKDIEQVKTLGKIVYPFLGVRYVIINEEIQAENSLSVDYGAWIIRGDNPGDAAIFPGSPAEKVGLQEGDIILEFDSEKITIENNLAKIIMKHDPGDRVVLEVLRSGQKKLFNVTLSEKSS
ncbi:MAG: hypothetical protein A2Z78_01300 [Candidatus Nealsonbacteria bacterium RBG_13_36_15]|uniref:PDZ domain-containing protein n=1 Tax=Candidatus Nealsonbacteria bacterium RBG_13_36_15 TaxID=1801660 RepID=A0A1G2DWU5_9BACT|nr:MAG: hypothetical protein A2Z78_01300 [Candidatus Nealsonbacteria bacterium RBG_13_36_15]